MYNLRLTCVDRDKNTHIAEIESTFDLSNHFKIKDKITIKVENQDLRVQIENIEKV